MLKELQKQFRAVVMPSLSLNAAAMVFDGAEGDAQPCAGMFGFLPHAPPVVAFCRRPGAP
ncbi:MAG: hypothetical protein E5Y18_19425 [Mesorhizobium sp.]|nr:MAG: hypothetical protein E5Y18_19425 [Mesorhizobium sp.]